MKTKKYEAIGINGDGTTFEYNDDEKVILIEHITHTWTDVFYLEQKDIKGLIKWLKKI